MVTRQKQRAVDHAAADNVLHTPELLENILSFLDMRTLLTVAQRVCEGWRITISNSAMLQRVLHLRAQPDTQLGSTQNPLLVQAFPAWFEGSPESTHGPRSDRSFGREAFTRSPMCESALRRQAFMRAKASWRRMLVVQPPVQKLGCWMEDRISGCLPDDSVWKFKILEFPQGLRMGKLYDLTQRWLGLRRMTRFAVFWTPKVYESLHGFYFLKVHEPDYEALRRCGAAVDLILRGERWESLNGARPHAEEQDAPFGRLFALKDREDMVMLEPEKDSGYRPARQWAAELETTAD